MIASRVVPVEAIAFHPVNKAEGSGDANLLQQQLSLPDLPFSFTTCLQLILTIFLSACADKDLPSCQYRPSSSSLPQPKVQEPDQR